MFTGSHASSSEPTRCPISIERATSFYKELETRPPSSRSRGGGIDPVTRRGSCHHVGISVTPPPSSRRVVGVLVRDTRTWVRRSPVEWASHGRRIPRRSAPSLQSHHPPSSGLCTACLWVRAYSFVSSFPTLRLIQNCDSDHALGHLIGHLRQAAPSPARAPQWGQAGGRKTGE
jgi:hypothetical protein